MPTARPQVPEVLAALGQRGIQSVFVEGGARLAGAFLEANSVDVVQWFLAPMLIGGSQAPGAIGGHGVGKLADAPRLAQLVVARIGDDIACAGRVIELPRIEE